MDREVPIWKRIGRCTPLPFIVMGLLLLGLLAGGAGALPGQAEAPAVPSALAVAAADWPQVQRDPQHTGYSPETLGTNFRVAWTHPFQPERVYPQVQAIVAGGKVFVGTESGNLYALDASTGAIVWTFKAGGPIVSSVAAAGGKVFLSCMDGAVYGLDAGSGAVAWKAQLSGRLGFSTSPVFADNKVLLGGRNGIFYALDPGDGHVIWQYHVGSPIFETAAWNAGRVYFGARDMRFYSLNTATTDRAGSLAWKTPQVDAMSFKDYWPVVHAGRVFVQAMMMGEHFFAFDENTGNRTGTWPQFDGQTMNGATTPPCVDRDGRLIVPALRTPNSYNSGWGRLNLENGSVEVLLDSTDPAAGFGNLDENLNVSCAANFVFSMHTEEYNANYTGAFNLDTHRWTKLPVGWRNGQMSTNTQGGGGNPASIANGMIYHISYHELVARSAQ